MSDPIYQPKIDLSQYLASCYLDEVNDTNHYEDPNATISTTSTTVASNFVAQDEMSFDSRDWELDQVSMTSAVMSQNVRSNSITTSITTYNSPPNMVNGAGLPSKMGQLLPMYRQIHTQGCYFNYSQQSRQQQQLPAGRTIAYNQNLDPILITCNEDEISDIEQENILAFLSEPNTPPDNKEELQYLVFDHMSDARTISKSPTPEYQFPTGSFPPSAGVFYLPSQSTHARQGITRPHQDDIVQSSSSNILMTYPSNFQTSSSSNSEMINELKQNLNLLPQFEFKQQVPILKSQSQPIIAIERQQSYTPRSSSFSVNGQTTPFPYLNMPPSSPTGLLFPVLAGKPPSSGSSQRRRKNRMSSKPRKTSEKTSLIISSSLFSEEYPVTLSFNSRRADFARIVKNMTTPTNSMSNHPNTNNQGTINTSQDSNTYCMNESDDEEMVQPRLGSDIYSIGPKVLPLPFSRAFMELKKSKFIPLSEHKKNQKYKLPEGVTSNYRPTGIGPHRATEPELAGLGSCRLTYDEIDLELSQESSFQKRSKSKKKSKKPNKARDIERLSDSKNDRYYSRLNIYELSRILELDGYHISLTKEIEVKVLELFGNYCDFKLGHQTWVRDTTREGRQDLITKLYSYSSVFYPELDPFKLEVIIRRGSYSLMQTRLRRERRMNRHLNRTNIETK